MAKKAAILRAFPLRTELCFNGARQNLLICQGKQVFILCLKTNTLTALFTGDYSLDQFCFSPDDNFVYISSSYGECVDNLSRVLKMDAKTHELCDDFLVPLSKCEAMTFSEKDITMYGKRYDTHMEGDGHELFDEYFARFHLNTLHHTNHLEEDIEKNEYTREVKVINNNTFHQLWQTLPSKIEIYYSQNEQTEFWDDTKYCNLRYDGELLQRIPHDRILEHISENINFPCYALKQYENFALLIGYEG